MDEFTAGYATDVPYTYGGTIDCRIEAAKMARDELPDLFGDCCHDVCSDAWLAASTETQLRRNCICSATWDVAFAPQPKLARSPTGTALSCDGIWGGYLHV